MAKKPTRKTCARCGTRFSTSRPNARFCSGACRSAAAAARKAGRPEKRPQLVAPREAEEPPAPAGAVIELVAAPSLYLTTKAEFQRRGVALEDVGAAAALLLAHRIDTEKGLAGIPGTMKEFWTARDQALKVATVDQEQSEGDIVDQLQASARALLDEIQQARAKT